MNDNIGKCIQCGLVLIMEEENTHSCRPVVSHMIIDGQLWLGDGITYYPIKRNFRPIRKPRQPKGNNEKTHRRGYSAIKQ